MYLSSDTHAVLLHGHVGQMYEHVIKLSDACVVFHRAETTETKTISNETYNTCELNIVAW